MLWIPTPRDMFLNSNEYSNPVMGSADIEKNYYRLDHGNILGQLVALTNAAL